MSALRRLLPHRRRPARPRKVGRRPDGEALYLGTTSRAGKHYRLASGELFGSGPCRYWIDGDTVLLERRPGSLLALEGVAEVGVAGAHAGKVLAPRRIAIITWTSSGAELDTGLGFEDTAQAEAFADALAAAARLPADRGPHAGA